MSWTDLTRARTEFMTLNLLQTIPANMEVEPAPSSAPTTSASVNMSASSSAAQPAPVKLPKAGGSSAVELEAYLSVIVCSMVARAGMLAEAGNLAKALIPWMTSFNRRTLDFFQARAWTIATAAAESSGTMTALVPDLLAAHRTATLRHDEYGQAVALNSLLRAYILCKDYPAAAALLSKAPFPESVSTSQQVRHLYYTGRVKAVTQDYAQAHAALLQVRMSPVHRLGDAFILANPPPVCAPCRQGGKRPPQP